MRVSKIFIESINSNWAIVNSMEWSKREDKKKKFEDRKKKKKSKEKSND